MSGVSRGHFIGDYASLWAAMSSIAPKINCTPTTQFEWVKRAEIDSGARAGVTGANRERITVLERENREPRQ